MNSPRVVSDELVARLGAGLRWGLARNPSPDQSEHQTIPIPNGVSFPGGADTTTSRNEHGEPGEETPARPLLGTKPRIPPNLVDLCSAER